MIKNITVIGSGTMGNGIAHVFAQFGFNVSLIDINRGALAQALLTISNNLDKQIKKGVINDEVKTSTLENIKIYTDLATGAQNADLVVEAATENRDIKLNLFKQLGEICSMDTILASNTSSISITEIASVTKHPENVIGMHFMNPVLLMRLVEVIKGKVTAPEVTATIINEAIYTLYEKVSGVEEIDTVMKLGMAHPMGPLQLADFIGLDICLAILNVLYTGFNNEKYAPCPLLVTMVAEKNLGVKSGSGFYKYIAGSKELVVANQFKH